MTRTATAATLAAALFAMPATAELVTKPSAYAVGQTADRLEEAVEEAGAAVIARVDHQASAEGADLTMPPAILVIFGNPKVGTPVMQEDLRAGLTLPLRVLVHADGEDTVVTYHTAESLFAGMDVDPAGEAAERIDGALEMLTDKATTLE